MQTLRLRGTKRYQSGGRTYWYFRATGERLPDDPHARAMRVLEIHKEREKFKSTPRGVVYAPGSFDDLCDAYLRSDDYQRLSMTTRGDYRERIDWLRRRFGALDVAGLDREFVVALRDKLAAKPRAADWMLQVLRRLLYFALDRPSRFGLQHNPAARFKRAWRPSATSNRPWTQAELAAMVATPGAIATACMLGAHLGQREADILRLTWAQYDGDAVTLRQGKTGEQLVVPVHPDLAEHLAGLPRTELGTIVVGARGRPLTGNGFRTLFQRARSAAGLSGITFHGLRHTAAQALAEAGCSEAEIRAVLGHRTSQMAQHYTRRADQTRLAEAAVARLSAPSKKNKVGRKMSKRVRKSV